MQCVFYFILARSTFTTTEEEMVWYTQPMRPQSMPRTRKNYNPSDFTDTEKRLIAQLLLKKTGQKTIVRMLGKPRMNWLHLKELLDNYGGREKFLERYAP